VPNAAVTSDQAKIVAVENDYACAAGSTSQSGGSGRAVGKGTTCFKTTTNKSLPLLLQQAPSLGEIQGVAAKDCGVIVATILVQAESRYCLSVNKRAEQATRVRNSLLTVFRNHKSSNRKKGMRTDDDGGRLDHLRTDSSSARPYRAKGFESQEPTGGQRGFGHWVDHVRACVSMLRPIIRTLSQNKWT
jgi:hypothetical protein